MKYWTALMEEYGQRVSRVAVHAKMYRTHVYRALDALGIQYAKGPSTNRGKWGDLQ